MGRWYSKNESGKSLLVFEETDESKEFDTVTLSMLINNNISSLVPCSFSQIDDTRYIKFSVSSKIEFREFMDRQTTFDIVADLFINMCRSFIELHKYMIDGEALFVDTDKMYIDVSVPIAEFIINPILEEQSPVDFKRFFQDIVVQLKLDSNDSRYIGPVLNMLNDKNFSLEGFIEELEKIKSSKSLERNISNQRPHGTNESVKPSPFSVPTPAPVIRPVNNDGWSSKPETASVNKISPKKDEDSNDSGGILRGLISGFGKKAKSADKSEKQEKNLKSTPRSNSLGGIAIPGQEEDLIGNMGRSEKKEPTKHPDPTPLSSKNVTKEPEPIYATPSYNSEDYVAPMAKGIEEDDTTQMMGGYSDDGVPKLIRTSTHEVIEIDKDSFNLGRDPKALLDYVINDGRVSRRHASILYKNGNYYVIDRGSRNHTFLNGRMLIANVENEITNGDVIKLASEEFVFEL